MYTDYTDIPRFYTVTEVSKLFDVSEYTVKQMIKDGRLDARKVGTRYEITEESMKRLVKEGSKKHDR